MLIFEIISFLLQSILLVPILKHIQEGGYSKISNRKKTKKLKKFEIKDVRTPKEMQRTIKKLGIKPIWKDWDYYLGKKCNI